MEAETDIRYGDMLKTRCMRGLLDFARFSFSVKSGGERFIVGRHHRSICEALDNVVSGRTRRLIINIAPRYGKTELAVKAAKEGDKILDLCTGSGCIAVALARYCADRRVEITAADKSADALSLAAENVAANGARVRLVESDLLASVEGKFDLIVCNPPYIKRADLSGLQREVRDYEPAAALDGGEDGLDFYRRLTREAPGKLKAGGMLLVECGAGQARQIAQMFCSFARVSIIRDYAGIERFVRAVVPAAEAEQGSAPSEGPEKQPDKQPDKQSAQEGEKEKQSAQEGGKE